MNWFLCPNSCKENNSYSICTRYHLKKNVKPHCSYLGELVFERISCRVLIRQGPVLALAYRWYHHHHHVVPQARISLTLSCHFSLSFIASGTSSGPHSVSSHSWWMYVRAGRPAFARLYLGVHRSTSLMSSSLLLQQWPACLVRLTWIVFVMGGRWLYSRCLVGCCRQWIYDILILNKWKERQDIDKN